MSSAYHVEASVIEGYDKGNFKEVYWDLGAALAKFLQLVPLSEEATLHYSS